MIITKVERGSVAEQLLQFGDIITNIDDKKIESRKEFEELIAELSKNDCNVYVTRVIEHTLAGMSLAKGDAILDVDSIPVTTVSDTSNIICANLRKNGYATLVIEQPNDPLATAHVRLALMAEKSMEIDLPLAPDVIDICQQEYKRMKRDPDLKPNQNILKTQRQAFCKHSNIIQEI
ncbi:PDZ domain family protein [Brugia pahangi]